VGIRDFKHQLEDEYAASQKAYEEAEDTRYDPYALTEPVQQFGEGPIRSADTESSFKRGLRSGLEGTAGAYHGVKSAAQALVGADDAAIESAERAQKYFEAASFVAPEINTLEDIESLEDAGSFVAAKMGEALPSLATIIAGGGVGGVVAKTAAHSISKKLIATTAKKQAKRMTKDMALSAAQRGALPVAGREATRRLAGTAAQEISRKGIRRTAFKTAIGTGMGLEAGGIMPALVTDPATRAGWEAIQRGERITDARNGVKGYAVKWVDGDTFDFQPEDGSAPYRIRVPHINTADVGQEGKDEAAQYLRELTEGEILATSPSGKVDRFGRQIDDTYLSDSDESIGELVLKSGRGVVHPRYEGQEHLYKLEREGRGAEGALPGYTSQYAKTPLTREQIEARDKRGTIPEPAESIFGGSLSLRQLALVSLGGGVVAGALEALPVLRVFNKFGGKTVEELALKEIKNGVVKRMGKEALIQSVTEGSTEAMQEVISRTAMKVADQNKEILGEEGVSAIMNAFAAGAIAGGPFGALGGIPAPAGVDPKLTKIMGDLDKEIERQATLSEVDIQEMADDFSPEAAEAMGLDISQEVGEGVVPGSDEAFAHGMFAEEVNRIFEDSKPELSGEAIQIARGKRPAVAREMMQNAVRGIHRRLEQFGAIGQGAEVRTLLDKIRVQAEGAFETKLQQDEFVADYARGFFEKESSKLQRALGSIPDTMNAANVALSDAKAREDDISAVLEGSGFDITALSAEQTQALIRGHKTALYRNSKTLQGRIGRMKRSESPDKAELNKLSANLKSMNARRDMSDNDILIEAASAYRSRNAGQYNSQSVVDLENYINKTLPKRQQQLERKIANNTLDWNKLFDPKNPEKFLEHFLTLELDPRGKLFDSSQRVALSPRDLSTKLFQDKVVSQPLRQPRKAADLSKSQEGWLMDNIENPYYDPPKGVPKLKEHDIVGVRGDGKPVIINAMSLSQMMYQKEKGQKLQDIEGVVNSQERLQQVSDQLIAGLNSLRMHQDIQVDLDSIPDNVKQRIVVYKSGSAKLTLADVMTPSQSETAPGVYPFFSVLDIETGEVIERSLDTTQVQSLTDNPRYQVFDPSEIEQEPGAETGTPDAVPLAPIYRDERGDPVREIKEERFEKRKNKGERVDEDTAASKRMNSRHEKVKDLRDKVDSMSNQAAYEAFLKLMPDAKRRIMPLKKHQIKKELAQEVRKLRQEITKLEQAEGAGPTMRGAETAVRGFEGQKPVGKRTQAKQRDSGAKVEPLDDALKRITEAGTKKGVRKPREPLTIRELIKAEDTTTHQKMQEFADRIVEKMGLDVNIKILTLEEALKVAPHKKDRIERNLAHGFHATKGKTSYIFVHPHPDLTAVERFEILSHEIGHAVFGHFMRNADNATKQAMNKAYQTWVKKHGRTDLHTAVEGKKPFFYAMNRMERGHNIDIQEMSEEQQEYLVGSETGYTEWFADNVARWMEMNKRPRSLVDKFFKEVADAIKAAFAQMKKEGYMPNRKVAGYLNSLWDNKSNTTVETVAKMKEVAEETKAPDKATKVLDRVAKRVRAHVGKDVDPQEALMAASMLDNNDFQGNQQAVRDALYTLLNAEERGILSRAFTSFPVMRQLERELAGTPGAVDRIRNNPDEAVAYGYALLREGRIKLGPQANGVFAKLLFRIREILGIVTKYDQAGDILKVLQDQQLRLRKEANPAMTLHRPKQLTQNKLQYATAQVRNVLETVGDPVQKILGQGYANLVGMGNPHVRLIVQQFQRVYGYGGIKETWHEGVRRMSGKFEEHIQEIVNQYGSTDYAEQIIDGLQRGQLSEDPEIRRAQQAIQKVMRLVRAYAKRNGVEIGSRGPDYFPRNYDIDTIQQDPEGFKQLIIQYAPDDFYRMRVTYDPATGKRTQQENPAMQGVEITDEMKQRKADAIYAAIVRNNGEGDLDFMSERIMHRPYMGAQELRTLNFLDDHRDELAPFLQKDLGATLYQYVNQSVKRAEFVKRFGKNGEKMEEMYQKARSHGATPAQMEQLQKFTDAQMGVLGADIDPKLQKAMGAMIVYQNMRLLSTALFSSLVDPLGIAVRSGDMRIAWHAYKAGWEEIKAKVKDDKTATRELAETLGTIEMHTTNEALQWQYGGTYLTGGLQRMNEWFFNITMLTQFTRFTRVMGVAGATEFLKSHSQNPTEHSARYLDELGLREGDLQFTDDGNVKVMSYQEYADLLAERDVLTERKFQGEDIGDAITQLDARIEREDRVQSAINRWVDGAILRPTAATRPTWASDPKWMLVFHMKGFMYSFYDTIIRRGYHEAAQQNDWRPAMMMGMYIPGMMMAEVARDALQHMLGDDPHKEGWEVEDHAWYAFERSGLLGVGEIAVNADQDMKHGKFPMESVLGPTAEWSIQGLRALAGGKEEATKRWLSHSLPFQNTLRPWAERMEELYEE